jgi:hypothetical protein
MELTRGNGSAHSPQVRQDAERLELKNLARRIGSEMMRSLREQRMRNLKGTKVFGACKKRKGGK